MKILSLTLVGGYSTTDKIHLETDYIVSFQEQTPKRYTEVTMITGDVHKVQETFSFQPV